MTPAARRTLLMLAGCALVIVASFFAPRVGLRSNQVLGFAGALWGALCVVLLASGKVQPSPVWGHTIWSPVFFTVGLLLIGLRGWLVPETSFVPIFFIVFAVILDARARTRLQRANKL